MLNNIHTFEEMKNKHKSRVPKNHPISNIINLDECVVTRRQLRLNETSIVCYTSQLEPNNEMKP